MKIKFTGQDIIWHYQINWLIWSDKISGINFLIYLPNKHTYTEVTTYLWLFCFSQNIWTPFLGWCLSISLTLIHTVHQNWWGHHRHQIWDVKKKNVTIIMHFSKILSAAWHNNLTVRHQEHQWQTHCESMQLILINLPVYLRLCEVMWDEIWAFQ